MTPVGPLLAFTLTAALIVLLRPVAVAVGLVDVPSGRKSHHGNVPLIGGMAIFFASLLVYYALMMLDLAAFAFDHDTLRAYFAGCAILICVGVWDDYADLPPAARLFAQVCATLVMIIAGGAMLRDLGNLSLGGNLLVLGIFSIPFTVFACLGVINAMNMCDGLDGLTGSMALIALAGLGIADLLWGDSDFQQLILLFAASVAGFLVFNLRTQWRARASVFLGDAGSMLLGFTLTWLLICLSQGEDRVISPAAALWFLMLPIYDAVSMMLRRLLRRRSPFAADREHLHHIFLLAGFSVAETVRLMSCIAIAGVCVGIFGTMLQLSEFWLAGAFLAFGLIYYWAVCRAWRVMRFLKRSICRRGAAKERRRGSNANQAGLKYSGPERRVADRRKAS